MYRNMYFLIYLYTIALFPWFNNKVYINILFYPHKRFFYFPTYTIEKIVIGKILCWLFNGNINFKVPSLQNSGYCNNFLSKKINQMDQFCLDFYRTFVLDQNRRRTFYYERTKNQSSFWLSIHIFFLKTSVSVHSLKKYWTVKPFWRRENLSLHQGLRCSVQHIKMKILT